MQCGRGDRQAWLDDAHARLEAQAGRPLPRLHEAWRAAQGPIVVNVALIRALRPSYRTGILSNADASLPGRLRDLGFHDLCEAVVCSADVGIAKPDAAIYRLAAARLALAPEVCLFVDDSDENVEAARQVGMIAIHHRVDRGDDLAAQLAAAGVRPAQLS
jgi:putative hydrolase of the HAD superfamily